ncbi:MAG: DUF763 domain-containing protein [Steroidobacteraceae bacterium]|jgi:uncharacterized protein
MHQRTGTANLPLHGGHVPAWLSTRMASLGRVIVEAIVHEYGRDELLLRLAHPFWFQSFGAVMGMDWHSSGITTSVMGALKRGLAPIQRELGVYVCGGKGSHSRRTPEELVQMGERTGQDAAPLVQSSRLVAKIDSAAVQDGFDLYLHSFVATAEGHWCIIQQGMNETRREARRYHWQSEGLSGFFNSPHAAIEGRNVGAIVNLADVRAERSRAATLALVQGGPDQTINVLRRSRQSGNLALPLFPEAEPSVPLLPHLDLPHHHDVRASDIMLKRLHSTLSAAADAGPRDFSDLLLTPGIGARTVEALAFVAEVVHGAPSRFADPARFSFAHGGKDGHPFPVPIKVFDETIGVLKRAVHRAKLGSTEGLAAIARLDAQARMLEGRVNGPDFESLLVNERALSASLGGRTVRGPSTALPKP